MRRREDAKKANQQLPDLRVFAPSRELLLISGEGTRELRRHFFTLLSETEQPRTLPESTIIFTSSAAIRRLPPSLPIMAREFARSGWVGASALLLSCAVLVGCAALPSLGRTVAPPPEPEKQSTLAADDYDYVQLIAHLRADLNRYNSREIVRNPTVVP